MHLDTYDISFCIRRLPKKLKTLMMEHGEQIIIAGGFIRSVITGEPISDIDIFAGDKEASEKLAIELINNKKELYKTDNAITIRTFKIPIQFIHRWVYDNPIDVILSFDFSICQAAIWYNKDKNKWSSQCADSFYSDLAAKRLVYLSPIRNEDAGGSLLRVLKYYQRGYRIPLDSFGAVLARLLSTVSSDTWAGEKDLATIITGLLIEVDPAGFVDHEAYLPAKNNEDGRDEGYNERDMEVKDD